jgi:RNA polymerase sigma-70 factor (ECF subfamily)
VIELNRAAAMAEAGDTEAALVLAECLEFDGYHYLHSTHTELLGRRLRRRRTRRYQRALGLVHSDAERRFVQQRLLEPTMPTANKCAPTLANG